MKKVVLLIVVLCALAGAINAQQISASPLEGHWVWDGRGSDIPDFVEVVFFGNIMLIMEDHVPFFIGFPFDYTDRTINVEDFGFVLYYRFLDNILIFIDPHLNEEFHYTKTQTPRSPLEGIWQVTGGVGYIPGEAQHMLFTGGIMAIGEDHEYFGMHIDFEGRTFRPSIAFLGDAVLDISEDELEEYLNSMRMSYTLSGNQLTLYHQGEELTLRKIY